jgi:hypothetical protein
VVTGILTAELAVPLLHAVATELYAFAAGWLNAAIRLGVTDHRVAQAVLHRMRAGAGPSLPCRLRGAPAGDAQLPPPGGHHGHAPRTGTLRLFMS